MTPIEILKQELLRLHTINNKLENRNNEETLNNINKNTLTMCEIVKVLM